MFGRFVQFCLMMTLFSHSSGFNCRWINHKFRQYHSIYVTLLREMGEENSVGGGHTSISEDGYEWFLQYRHSQPVKQVWLVIQTLEETSHLLREADSVSWNQEQLEHILNTLDHTTRGLNSCVKGRMRWNDNRLSLYFSRLREFTQNTTGDKINTFEWIRTKLLDLLTRLESFPALRANHF